MKHRRGFSPKCWSCKYYTEEIEEDEKLHSHNTGWCTNKDYLRTGINGKRIENPPKHCQVRDRDEACRNWIDAEAGYTKFEVLTGLSEETLQPIDFEEEQQSLF